MLPELLRLATLLNGVGLREELLDSILSRFTENGEHLAKSAYMLWYEGSTLSKAGPRQVLVFSVARCFEQDPHDGHASRTQNERMIISALHVPEV
jgi:hypothetical protein